MIKQIKLKNNIYIYIVYNKKDKTIEEYNIFFQSKLNIIKNMKNKTIEESNKKKR